MTTTPAGRHEAPRAFPFLISRRRRTQGFREWLTPGDDSACLTMLWIPPGRFWMGSPADEPGRTDAEGPQHLVQLQGFFLGQTPVTQAQWRTVAEWTEREGERWGRSLPSNPSFFQPEETRTGENRQSWGRFQLLPGEATTDQRPVDSVSWHDAMEFCARLSQRTGRLYTLPSEARWEYACRAGTTTPFHFGPTLTTDLANFDGRRSASAEEGESQAAEPGDKAKGVYREQTTQVGSFPANAWGLHDLHGNVWEWCADHWNDNYKGAPEDGSPWLQTTSGNGDEGKPIDAYRLLRGGSWYVHPRSCRSAVRDRLLPGNRDRHVGFRVCCLPQD